MQESTQRKLAAIMFTDIAGYTQAMSSDEKTALELLTKKRSVIRPLIRDHRGKFVKEIGDGTLSYFNSAIDAATCAVRLQEVTFDDPSMNIRIGIHVGDIVIDEDDVFGDGVNVAARLESIAPVGGVCVSKSVFEELLNKDEFEGIPLGLQQLKGVGRLIDVFALKGERLRHPDPSQFARSQVNTHMDNEVPSLAIVPLKNRGSGDDDFYAYGITSDLITDITRAGRVRVASLDDIETIDASQLSSNEIASKLRVRYIVGGSLWKKGDLFQLSMEIKDSKKDSLVWSDRWQENWVEVGSIKDKIADSILKVINIETPRPSDLGQTITPEAYELYLRGMYTFRHRSDKSDIEIAAGLFSKSIEMNPNYSEAISSKGICYYSLGQYEKASNCFEEAFRVAQSNNDLPGKAFSLRLLGNIKYDNNMYKDAYADWEEALTITKGTGDLKGEAIARARLCTKLLLEGKYDEVLKHFEINRKIFVELDDKWHLANTHGGVGQIYTICGMYEEATQSFSEGLKIRLELGDKAGESNVKRALGFIERTESRFDKAREYFEESLAISKALNDKISIANTILNVGLVDYDEGKYDDAILKYQEYIQTYKELGMSKFDTFAKVQLALIMVKNNGAIDEILDLVEETEPRIMDGEEFRVGKLWTLSQAFLGLSERTDSSYRQDFIGKSEKYAREANNKLMEIANNIHSDKLRKSFLENVEENRMLIDTVRDL